MRFYDYKCVSCSTVVEYYETTNDNLKQHLCTCGGEMIRLISAPQFNFKKPKVDIKHSERRKRWNSKNPKDVLSI